jgi:hypothetical protein
MKIHEMKESHGSVSIRDRAIVLKMDETATFEVPTCESYELARAKPKESRVAKSKAVKSEEGAILHNIY